MIDRTPPENFARQAARIGADWRELGIGFADTRRSPALELHFGGANGIGPRPVGQTRVGVEPLEGGILSRPTPRINQGESRIRCFLDGAQRTLRFARIGLAPIFATVSAAAILDRDEDGRCTIRPGTLRLEKAWLAPHLPDAPELDAAIDRVRRRGGRVVDTLAHATPAERDTGAPPDYGRLEELALAAAQRVREELEHDLLQSWSQGHAGLGDDEWLIVDGRLEFAARNAIGLVKNFTEPLLIGADAEVLLGLPARHRTTAFHSVEQRRRAATTLWYLRLHDPTGRDPRHGLVRLEASRDVQRTDEIDAISSWVLAERTPRATSDERWAVLLYPIHLLERALKRQIEGECRGWPAS